MQDESRGVCICRIANARNFDESKCPSPDHSSAAGEVWYTCIMYWAKHALHNTKNAAFFFLLHAVHSDFESDQSDLEPSCYLIGQIKRHMQMPHSNS